eukprot:TRINITY_DN3754_c0_g1_i1.p1 TRINITY_DN3754_c0_g1~~TRINITY_DN3754_c0_g1_i1.p1  ORF type:complete len:1269 (+),score=505.08 TRINITY_DN3754_c0_g1_i1:116-3922(+)
MADRVNYEDAYRRNCEALGCRANSAVSQTLAKASFQPLREINLRDNYIGSRGVLPVYDLLEANHTVTKVDLSRNGLDNGAIQKLAAIAKTHKGLTALDISHNAYTQAVGKDLVALVEDNANIVDMQVGGAGLYESLIRRIMQGVLRNQQIKGVLPTLTQLAERPEPEAMGGAALRTPKPPATREDGEHSPQEAAAAGEEAAAQQYSATGAPLSGTPAKNRVKPRPAPPTTASHGFRRMTPQEREEARQNYLHRLQQHPEELNRYMNKAGAGATSIDSYKARRKLQDLQRQQEVAEGTHSIQDERLRQQHELQALVAGRQEAVAQATAVRYSEEAEKEEEIFANVELEQHRVPGVELSQESLHLLAQRGDRLQQAEMESLKMKQDLTKLDQTQHDRARLLAANEDAADGAPPDTAHARDADARPASAGGPSPIAGAEKLSQAITSVEGAAAAGDRFAAQLSEQTATFDVPLEAEAAAQPQASQLSIPTGLDANGVRFYELFNEGGVSYNDGRMEEAYVKWSEALQVATDAKNREWISIINGNIQALSYQLLTCQGGEHTTNGDLEEALKCFQLARDVAYKARNNAWVRASEASINTVRKAQFKDCYNAGIAIFDPLVLALKDENVNGDVTTKARAAAFEKELERVEGMLRALSQWTEALKYASQVFGNSSQELVGMVAGVVQVAFEYQSRLSFAPDDDMRPKHAGMRTHLYTAAQRARLIKVWDAIQCTVKDLDSAQWDALVCCVLGNLHHALFHNKQAEERFQRSVELARSMKLATVEASSLTHMARVFVGLARYGEAEKLLWAADALWTQLRSAEDCGPYEVYNMQQQSICYDLLQQIMISQYRYSEGLEMAERSRANTHIDQLQDKMRANFNVKTSADHMASLSRALQAVLVVYSTMAQFEWNVEEGEAIAHEQLCIWVMPTEGEIKFVLIDVTKDHNETSLEVIIDNLRSALCIDADAERREAGKPLSTGVIVDAPEYAWKHPLQQLYDFLIYPISDFLTVNAGLEFAPHRKVCFVPHGFLHLVPWAALMDANGRYFVEDFNVQVSPSVQVLALAKLNATKLRAHDGQKIAVVGGSSERTGAKGDLPYPFEDPVCDEGDAVAEDLGAPAVLRGGADAILQGITAGRLVHVAAEALGAYREGCAWGGVVCNEGVISRKALERCELSAELVALPCSNHSKMALLRGGDGVLELCRAFACSGAPTVIYSLWCTPHQSHASLLQTFYAHLRSEPDKAICLSHAMRQAIRDDPYGPASWASLYMFGLACL